MTTTTAPTTVTTQVYRVYIKATPEGVWEAITTPEWTQRYGYRVRDQFDLRPGGTYRSLANEGMRAVGAPDVAADGEVIEVDPPRRLVMTWRLLLDPESAAEGHTRVTYDVEPRDHGVTRLTVTHELENAPKLAILVAGELDDTGAGGGWMWILSDLKSLLETGAGLTP